MIPKSTSYARCAKTAAGYLVMEKGSKRAMTASVGALRRLDPKAEWLVVKTYREIGDVVPRYVP